MALILLYQPGTALPWETLDQDALGFCRVKLDVSYDHPSRLQFQLHTPDHTRPIPDRSLLALHDTDYAGYPERPIFLGHVTEIIPNGSHRVQYICYDVTMRARQEITVMSGPHANAHVIPRLVYNVTIDNDDDYALEYRHDATIGEIIADLLTNAYNELFTNCSAAPPLGGDAYLLSDLALLDFRPQEKITFESQRLGECLDRLLSYYPAYRQIFEPSLDNSANRWQFVDLLAGVESTLTLNDFSGASPNVLALSLRRGSKPRFTAVRIFGPRQMISTIVYQEESSSASSSGLTKLWTNQEEINFQTAGPAGPGVGDAARKWQISDPDRRQMARQLPDWMLIDDSQFNVDGRSYLLRRVRTPTLQATWDDGASWWTVPGFRLDIRDGIIECAAPIYRHQPTLTPEYLPPDNVRLLYAYFDDPVSVRHPATGFEGSAYSEQGVSTELRLYDELLAVGYEQGTTVSLEDRQAEYAKLAEQILQPLKDVSYSGGCTIEGIDYDYLLLQRRVNFDAIDADGQPLVTGWEDIRAVVTDVEFDFDDGLTTVLFHGDQADWMLADLDDLKQRLKRQALDQMLVIRTSLAANGDRLTISTEESHVPLEGA